MCDGVAELCAFSHRPYGLFLIGSNAVCLIRPEFLLRDLMCFVLLVRRVVDYQNAVTDLTLISF